MCQPRVTPLDRSPRLSPSAPVPEGPVPPCADPSAFIRSACAELRPRHCLRHSPSKHSAQAAALLASRWVRFCWEDWKPWVDHHVKELLWGPQAGRARQARGGAVACFGEQRHVATRRLLVLSAAHGGVSLAVAGGSCPILHWPPKWYDKLQLSKKEEAGGFRGISDENRDPGLASSAE